MLKLHISPLSSLDLCWSKQTILTPRIAGKSISCYSFRRYSSSRSSGETFNTIIMLACSLNLLYSSVWQLCHSLCIYHWVRWVWLYILSTSGWENLQPPFLWKSLTNPALSALNYKCMTVCVVRKAIYSIMCHRVHSCLCSYICSTTCSCVTADLSERSARYTVHLHSCLRPRGPVTLGEARLVPFLVILKDIPCMFLRVATTIHITSVRARFALY